MDLFDLHFDTPEGFLKVADQQFSRGGVFVQGAAASAQYAPATLSLHFLFAGEGQSGSIQAVILQVMPGLGVALQIPPQELPQINAWAERVRNRLPPIETAAEEADAQPADSPLLDPSVEAEELDDELRSLAGNDDDGAESGGLTSGTLLLPSSLGSDATKEHHIRELPVRKKLILALRGDRVVRGILMNDSNNTIHQYLLRNPRITLTEVQRMAGNPRLNPGLLKEIADEREWGGNLGIVKALVRNYKTPTPIAVALVDKLPVSDLKELSRLTTIKEPVREKAKQTLRKKQR